MDLKTHLETYGIRAVSADSYGEWRKAVLGELRMQCLAELRRPLQRGRATADELALYWDYIAEPEVAPVVFSAKADAICAAGEFVAHQLPPANSILDIGCSIGHLTTYYAHISPAAHVTGCDLSLASIERAIVEAGRQGLRNVSFRCGDWRHALAGQHFDCVVVTQALGQIGLDEPVAAQLASLLPDSGRLIVVESFDDGEALEAFIAHCARQRLAQRILQNLAFLDAGGAVTCPGLVFEKLPA